MTLTKRSIAKFRNLYFKTFGETLTEAEAEQKALYLLELYRTVFDMPLTGEFINNKINGEETQ